MSENVVTKVSVVNKPIKQPSVSSKFRTGLPTKRFEKGLESKFNNYILQYANDIEDGSIISSKRVGKIYKDLKDRILNPKGQYVFNKTKALHAITFIEKFCKHSKGEYAGKPLELELFQKAYISALFGFVDKETGLRQYKESLFMVGRKNGKSTMMAGIALYMLIADNESGAEVYSVATKKDQSKLIFNEAYNMIQQSRALNSVIRKRKTDLYFASNFSKFEALGKNSDTLDGLNSHLVIIDELHGIKDRNLYEVMKQSLGSREQPMLLMITTAGTVRENIFDDMYKYAVNVVDGNFEDDTFLGIIYELDSREEWKNPNKWIKANPSLGSIKKLDYLEQQVERAKNSPVDLRGILVKDFNIRDSVNGTWLNFDTINNTETFNLEDFRGYYAIGGADLSTVQDLTCGTILLMDRETDKRYIHQMYWLPKEGFEERVEREKIPYDKWLEQGLLRLTEGNKIDYSDVTAWFYSLVKDKGISIISVYYDSWNAEYWADEMRDYGFNMVECRQGYKTLSTPMKNLGADLEAKKVNYNNNPILKWCLTNTAVKSDINGNIMPNKAISNKYRIDGTASLLDSYVGLYERYNEFKTAQPLRASNDFSNVKEVQ